MREKLAHILGGFCLVARIGLQGVGPGGKVIPPRAAGGFRVGGDDRNAGSDQIAPILNVLRVPRPHQKHHGGGVGRAVVGQAALPVRRQQRAFLCTSSGNGVDVIGQRERDHIRRQAFDHRACLLAGATMGLADAHDVAVAGLPIGAEECVVSLEKFPCGIVGDVEHAHFRRKSGGGEQAENRQQESEHGWMIGDCRRQGKKDAILFFYPFGARSISQNRMPPRHDGA